MPKLSDMPAKIIEASDQTSLLQAVEQAESLAHRCREVARLRGVLNFDPIPQIYDTLVASNASATSIDIESSVVQRIRNSKLGIWNAAKVIRKWQNAN